MGIQAIENADIHKITSGQVIVDLRSAIKELLENSLDAKADKIEIIFKNYGIESIECADNGVGISEDDLDNVGQKHRTSKISSFEDVSKVTSFGFRGEAIASLCQMGKVIITTTTKGPKAYKIVFNHSGTCNKIICSRNTGTTVLVSNLFDTLPVRKKDFIKNYKRQFNRSIDLIQSYAIIQTNVKISVSNVLPSGKKTLILSSIGKSDITRNLVSVFGSNAGKGLASIDVDLDLSNIRHTSILPENQKEENASEFQVKITGQISMVSFGCGRASKDRQYVYINKRPVDYPKVAKTINETYQSFNNVQYPSFVLDFRVGTKFLDLNVTPDKRTVSLHYEEYVLDALRESLQLFFQKQGFVVPKSETTSVNPFGPKRIKVEPLDASTLHNSENSKIISNGNHLRHPTIIKDEVHELPRLISPFRSPTLAKMKGEREQSELKSSTVETEDLDDGFDDKLHNHRESVHKDEISANNHLDYVAEDVNTGPHLLNPHEKEGDTKRLFVDSDLENTIESESNVISKELDESEDVDIDKNNLKVTPKGNHIQLGDFLHRRMSNVDIEKSPVEVDELVVQIDNNISTIPASQDRDNKLVFHPHTSHSGNDSCRHSHNHSPNESDYSDDDFENGTDIVFKNTVENESDLEQIKKQIEGSSSESLSLHQINNLVTSVRASLKIEAEKSQKVVCAIEIDKAIKHERLVNEIASIDDKEKAEHLLTLTVSKNDFQNMTIVGQFNLGFIIVTRCKEGAFDLFIVDQHASDEKYNFEMLQKNTVFKSQSLLSPKTLELSVIDELLVMEYKDVFSKNGFKLSIDQEEEPGQRIKLVSFPVSKNTMFTEYDFHELIQLIREHEGHDMSNIRCSKIRSMFAMRACRSSIMIGKPLSMRTMKKVVNNLSDLEKPWNCPHGRPTLRHLMELKDWDSFCDDYMI